MAIRDRGKMKWQSAFFMPEHVKMLKDMERDFLRNKKPLIDEFEIIKFENKIHEAMEFANKIKFSIWHDGFIYEYIGLVHRLDGINKLIYVEVNKGEFEKVKFEDIVGVEIASK
jgi:hypothetical protein